MFMNTKRAALVLAACFTAGCVDDPTRPTIIPDTSDPSFGPTPDVGSAPGAAGAGGSGPIDTKAGVYSEPLVTANPPPPPVSGGTLLVLADGHKAAVADPDHDQVLIVAIDAPALVSTIALKAGDEPGRIIEDGAGRIHVALRSAGAVATIDPTPGSVLRRDAICSYPRGLGYDATADTVVVACAGGDLVTVPAAGGTPLRSITLHDATGRLLNDLRDVVIEGDRALVSRFRAAEVLVVEADGSISATLRPRIIDPSFAPAVAWRTVAAPGGGVVMVHQEDQITPVQIGVPGGYGGFCGGIVRTAVSIIKLDGSTSSTPIGAVLPVDVAVDPGQSVFHVAAAGARPGRQTPVPEVAVTSFSSALEPSTIQGGFDAGLPCGTLGGGPFDDILSGQPVAVAATPSGSRLVQTREPATVVISDHTGDHTVMLPGPSRMDTGHDIFHLGTMGGIACASCHPEGHEDGHVWQFTDLGARRTQSIAGGILGTEPFHWGGDMKDFGTLSHDVFNSRMSGPALADEDVTALANWINALPVQKAAAAQDAAAVERGRALFNSPAGQCSTCHSGAKMTNNTNVDVGTGGLFQVPSLRGVSWRAPYMHNGCAPTLADRFGPCGGSKHGPALDPSQKADLVAYLQTL
jgi:mono/diheme cytochrome c family protein